MERLIIIALIILIFVTIYKYRDNIQKYLYSPKNQRQHANKKNNAQPKLKEKYIDVQKKNTNKGSDIFNDDKNISDLPELNSEENLDVNNASELSSSKKGDELSSDTITKSSSVFFSHSEIENQ